MDKRTCKACGVEKLLDDFYLTAAGNPLGKCKSCCNRERVERWNKSDPDVRALTLRKSDLKRRYGITYEQYEDMLEAQNGVCAICGGHSDRGVLHVDHDHTTGRVRGLLCFNCNAAMGHLNDDPARLRACVNYLESHSHA